MISTRIHRRVNLFTRFGIVITACGALAFFVTILFYIFDNFYYSQKPGMSALTTGALGYTVLWTLISIIVLLTMDFNRFIQIAGDIISFLVLVVVGSIGFAHDDRTYLQNGLYVHSYNENWLNFAIAGGVLAIIAMILQVFLVVWAFLESSTTILPKTISGNPPAYFDGDKEIYESEKGAYQEWDSTFESDMTRPMPVVEKDKALHRQLHSYST